MANQRKIKDLEALNRTIVEMMSHSAGMNRLQGDISNALSIINARTSSYDNYERKFREAVNEAENCRHLLRQVLNNLAYIEQRIQAARVLVHQAVDELGREVKEETNG